MVFNICRVCIKNILKLTAGIKQGKGAAEVLGRGTQF